MIALPQCRVNQISLGDKASWGKKARSALETTAPLYRTIRSFSESKYPQIQTLFYTNNFVSRQALQHRGKMASVQYQYSKLSQDSRQIRLVHILPGIWDDPISCQLHTASLDSSLTYQALSYVWGDPKVTKPISLHGSIFSVTLNLHVALRRLRCAIDTRIIWIDALCINQRDIDERTQQVVLMSSIYQGCSEVIMGD